METITLGLFSLILVVCLLFRLPTLYALFAGLILFCEIGRASCRERV